MNVPQLIAQQTHSEYPIIIVLFTARFLQNTTQNRDEEF